MKGLPTAGIEETVAVPSLSLQLGDGEVGEGALGLRRRRGGGAAEAGKVPDAILLADEVDGRGIDGEFCNADLAMEEERTELDADVQGLGLQERRGAEGRVVGDGDVFCDQAAAEERKAEMTEGDLAAEGAGELVLELWPEGIGIDEEGSDDNDDDDQCDDRDDQLSANAFAWKAPL